VIASRIEDERLEKATMEVAAEVWRVLQAHPQRTELGPVAVHRSPRGTHTAGFYRPVARLSGLSSDWTVVVYVDDYFAEDEPVVSVWLETASLARARGALAALERSGVSCTKLLPGKRTDGGVLQVKESLLQRDAIIADLLPGWPEQFIGVRVGPVSRRDLPRLVAARTNELFRRTLPLLLADMRDEPRAKYGPGGEGREHAQLKRAVHDSPHLVGLSSGAKGQIERAFATGNRAVIFAEGDLEVAVEVEVEGENATMIGPMQAVKYRVLLAMERGLALKSPRISAILVAHHIPPRRVASARGTTSRLGS
jgi:hypothetical protein